MGHPDRKSVSFALFSAFLTQLETTYTATAPAGYSRAELMDLLRRAAFRVAIERVNQEWARVAERSGVAPPILRQGADDALIVVRIDGVTGISHMERGDLDKYLHRVCRGLPELGL